MSRQQQMIKSFSTFLQDESAASAMEYGIIAAGTALAVLATVKEIGPKLYSAFAAIAADLPGFAAFGP